MGDPSVSLNDSLEEQVAAVVDRFMAEAEGGGRPDVEDYARRHPEIASVLRQVLPALRVIQSAGDGSAATSREGSSLEEAGGVLGDFRILREVGRGGMGIVYEAEQISLRRRVALKVLPFAATMDPRHLQRFHNEARAAACLHHEHIVPVYFVGSERGVHFYAMQFVEGQSLAGLLAAQRGLAAVDSAGDKPAPAVETAAGMAAGTEGEPRGREYFRRVAEWGVQAAEALEHAHALGIVHRDVKPGNLMVDGRGKLWVTDFGLARLGADAGLTLTGDLLGTLRYMSPEQALAKHGLVDHRTDVYALGATLYELLTLRPAVEGEDREEVLRKITFEEPRPPRTLTQGIPIELETVLLKAMAKDPGARYATAQELADDLERFLRGEPIQARRISRLGQVWRWCRRNPLVASLLAVTVGLLAAVLVVGLVGYLQTRAALGQVTEEKQQAEANAAEARRQRYHAEANFGKALNILTDFMRKLDRTDGSRSPEKEAIRQALREHMETFFQRFLKENSEDPLVRSETAWAYDHLGLYDHKQGDTARAEKYFRKALAILQDRAEQFRTHFRYVGMLSHTYWRLGWLLEDTGRSREALESFRRTVEYARLALTLNRDADELNRLAWPLVICPYPEVRNPPLALQLAQEAVKLANERADLWNTLGGAYYRMGDWDAAVAALEKAVKLSRKGGKADDHFFLAMSHHRRGEEREARSWYEQGVRQMSRYPSDLFLQNEAAALLGIKNPSLPREKEDSPRKK